MKTLAFVTFIIWGSDGTEYIMITDQPVECEKTTDHFTMIFEAEGYEVDWFCDETGAPITSMRPEARP